MADEFMIGVNWIFSAVKVFWNWLTSIGFIGYCVIGLLVVRRVGKLVHKVLHK